MDRAWHTRLAVLTFLGIQLGYLKKGKAANLGLAACSPAEVGEDGEPVKGTTGGRQNSKVGQLRSKCRNT
eukprot:4378962-Lingulodinium_polyedra.AAC.1